MICKYPNCDGGYATGYCHSDCREAPQQWFTCDACDGSGEIVTGYWGYEPGCGHGHMMDHGAPCDRCGGEGGWVGDVQADLHS